MRGISMYDDSTYGRRDSYGYNDQGPGPAGPPRQGPPPERERGPPPEPKGERYAPETDDYAPHQPPEIVANWADPKCLRVIGAPMRCL